MVVGAGFTECYTAPEALWRSVESSTAEVLRRARNRLVREALSVEGDTLERPTLRRRDTGHPGQVIRGRDRLEEQTRHRLPPDRAALLLAGLLVAHRRAQRADTARIRVKVTEVLAHSVGRQNYVVGLTPAVIGALWAQLR
jgi:hypothetical protein